MGNRLIAIPLPQAINTFRQLKGHVPEGAYTTLRTYRHVYGLRIDAHLQRLEQTACLEGFSLTLAHKRLRAVLRQAISLDQPDLRLRLILDLEQNPGDMYIVAMPLVKPSQTSYKSGVWIVRVDLQRASPKAKLTRFLWQADCERQKLPSGVHEGVMVGKDRRVLEGMSSNFFAVRDEEIWTAEESVLSGTTRALVLEEISRLGIPIHYEGADYDALEFYDEAFITSASRAILPVRQVDSMVIGSGQPGEMTRLIMQVYDRRVENELELI